MPELLSNLLGFCLGFAESKYCLYALSQGLHSRAMRPEKLPESWGFIPLHFKPTQICYISATLMDRIALWALMVLEGLSGKNQFKLVETL
jgi:hypothetical protein